VQPTQTNKDPLIYAASSPHTDVSQLVILTTITLGSMNYVRHEDGVTAAKHVGVSKFHRAFFNSIIDKHQHIHFFTFNTINLKC